MRQIAQSKSSLHSQGGPEKPGRCGNTGSVWGMTCPLGGTLGDLDPARAGSGQHVTAWPGYQQYLARVTAVPGGSVQRTMGDLNLREDGLLRRDLKKVSPKFQALKNYTHTMMGFLVVQWLGIHLPMQGTRVRSLVQEDFTHHWAMKPVHHNY